MSLTAITPAKNTISSVTGMSTASLQVPRLLATAIAITTANSLGVAITQAQGSQNPGAIVTLTADADWWWADTDSVATANCQKVLACVPYPVQCTPGLTQNFYCKTATTANLIVTQVA